MLSGREKKLPLGFFKDSEAEYARHWSTSVRFTLNRVRPLGSSAREIGIITKSLPNAPSGREHPYHQTAEP
jgi:hypothetical protein